MPKTVSLDTFKGLETVAHKHWGECKFSDQFHRQVPLSPRRANMSELGTVLSTAEIIALYTVQW